MFQMLNPKRRHPQLSPRKRPKTAAAYCEDDGADDPSQPEKQTHARALWSPHRQNLHGVTKSLSSKVFLVQYEKVSALAALQNLCFCLLGIKYEDFVGDSRLKCLGFATPTSKSISSPSPAKLKLFCLKLILPMGMTVDGPVCARSH